jgi:hypothetical protein
MRAAEGDRTPGARSEFYVPIALSALGVAARLLLSAFSYGTDDSDAWGIFGWHVTGAGLLNTYVQKPLFNHPPLMGLAASASFLMHRALDIPFPFCMRLWPIAGDALAIVLVGQAWKGRSARWPWAAVAMAFCPVAFLVSAYHCNTDCLCAAFSLLACHLLQKERPFWAGLALAAALNVKIIALVLAVALIFHPSLRRRDRLVAFLGGLSLAAIPFLPLLVLDPAVIIRNVFAYNSNFNRWGLALPIVELQATQAKELFIASGRYLIFGGVIALSLWNRRAERLDAYQLGAAAYALFLVVTPGFGVQYTAYPAALLLAASLPWGLAYGIGAGLYLGFVYASFWTGTIPLASAFVSFERSLGLAAILPWSILLAFLVHSVRRPAQGIPLATGPAALPAP